VSYFGSWRPYVPVAHRRHNAERQLAKLKKAIGQPVSPVRIEGRTIARSFWGQAWCTNLERYSDFSNRLPRGRSYVRNGSVVDLQLTKGEIAAFVAGSDLYEIRIAIAPVKAARWMSIRQDCAGTVDSLVELLQGRLDKAVMDRVCRKGDGLFPAPAEIKMSCSCPDWADMCKHVAAVLYGVGARLDERPELLFELRGVDENELIARAGQNFALAQAPAGSAKVLDDGDVAVLFGLEMAETARPDGPHGAQGAKESKIVKEQIKPRKAKRPPLRPGKRRRASVTEANEAIRPVRGRKNRRFSLR
jgi:uncharacterized Zn finger protein